MDPEPPASEAWCKAVLTSRHPGSSGCPEGRGSHLSHFFFWQRQEVPGAKWCSWCLGSARLTFIEKRLDVRSRLGGAKKGGRAWWVLRGHRVLKVRHMCGLCGPYETDWEVHLLQVEVHGEVGVQWGRGEPT